MKTKQFFPLLAMCMMLLGGVQHAKAQFPVKFGIGLEAGLPLTDGLAEHLLGIGATFNASYAMPFHEPLEAIASVGYRRFVYYERLEGVSDPHYVPIKLGARYNFNTAFPLFAKLEFGPVISLQDAELGEGTGFMVSPGVGTLFGPVRAELKYEEWMNSGIADFGLLSQSFLGLKFTYDF